MGTEPDNHTLRELGSGAMTRHDTEVLQREGKTDLTQTSNFRVRLRRRRSTGNQPIIAERRMDLAHPGSLDSWRGICSKPD